MTDDATQSEPVPTESTLAREGAAPTSAESVLPSPEPTPVSTDTSSAGSTTVIPEKSQSAQEIHGDSRPMSQPTSSTQPAIQRGRKWSADDRAKSAATKTRKKDAHLAQIVEYAKAHDGIITNDEIEKLLHVSDATASRYAKSLVAGGALRQEGKGRGAKYVLIV